MNKSPQYNQQTDPKQCKSEIEENCIMNLPKPGKWPSLQHLYLKINSGFHAKKNLKQQYLKVVTFSDASFSKKRIFIANLYLRPCNLDNTLKRPSIAWERFNIREKLGLFVFRGHSHIESSHSFHQIDASGWVGLALWR